MRSPQMVVSVTQAAPADVPVGRPSHTRHRDGRRPAAASRRPCRVPIRATRDGARQPEPPSMSRPASWSTLRSRARTCRNPIPPGHRRTALVGVAAAPARCWRVCASTSRHVRVRMQEGASDGDQRQREGGRVHEVHADDPAGGTDDLNPGLRGRGGNTGESFEPGSTPVVTAVKAPDDAGGEEDEREGGIEERQPTVRGVDGRSDRSGPRSRPATAHERHAAGRTRPARLPSA